MTDHADPELVDRLARLAGKRLTARDGLGVLGICGAQGSGKSSLAAALEHRLNGVGVPCARLSLDDLYLSRAARQKLAAAVHPLFATRGVPGTHDLALGLAALAALERGEPAALPRFDKGSDEPMLRADWPRAPARCRVLVLEGWCMGAVPQSPGELALPVNALEAQEDPQGIWRGHANTALGGEYQNLFARIDTLVLLAVPGWDIVARWRTAGSRTARHRRQARDVTAQIARFIQHYERLTRHILNEMPARADLTVRLDAQRRIVSL
ncbi:MAG: kinase [Novosphingobium sp.]